MSDNILRNNVRDIVAFVPEEDHIGENTAAVVVVGGQIPWVLRFWARLGANRAYIGAVRLFASRQKRLAAILSIPGALTFEVEGKGAETTADQLEIHFEGIEARGGPWGVHAIVGNSVLNSRSYRVLTGVGAGVPFLCTGEVHGWTAYTTQVGGTVAIAADPNLAIGPIIVPQNGSISGNAMGLLAPVSTWTINNVDSYVIEYIPPGIEFDG